MQEEIFGPLLPIKPYKSLEEAIDYINQHQRPLALYVMSDDKSTIKHIVRNTHSGGVGINDTVLHVGAEDAPSVALGNRALVIITEWKDSEPLAMRKPYSTRRNGCQERGL